MDWQGIRERLSDYVKQARLIGDHLEETKESLARLEADVASMKLQMDPKVNALHDELTELQVKSEALNQEAERLKNVLEKYT